jgi:hypothetical protein
MTFLARSKTFTRAALALALLFACMEPASPAPPKSTNWYAPRRPTVKTQARLRQYQQNRQSILQQRQGASGRKVVGQAGASARSRAAASAKIGKGAARASIAVPAARTQPVLLARANTNNRLSLLRTSQAKLKSSTALSTGSVKLPRTATAKPNRPPLTNAEKDAILSKAARGQNANQLGITSHAEADELGKRWVGQNYTVTKQGFLVSADGLRRYRPPRYKVGQQKTQANLDGREKVAGAHNWDHGEHIEVQ